MDESDRIYFLWIMLNQTDKLMSKLRKKELARHRIIFSENFVLIAVHYLGDRATPAEISRLTFQEPQTVSKVINKMEAKKLLLKEQVSGFKNRVLIKLTDKGQRLYDKSSKRESISPIISSLSLIQELTKNIITTLPTLLPGLHGNIIRQKR